VGRLKSRTTRLGTFEGGFQNFANLFAQKLRDLGVQIRLQTPVTLIERDAAGKLTIHGEQARPMTRCW